MGGQAFLSSALFGLLSREDLDTVLLCRQIIPECSLSLQYSVQVGGLSLPRQAMDYVRKAHSTIFLFLLSTAGQIGRDANSSRPVTSTVGALSAVAKGEVAGGTPRSSQQ